MHNFRLAQLWRGDAFVPDEIVGFGARRMSMRDRGSAHIAIDVPPTWLLSAMSFASAFSALSGATAVSMAMQMVRGKLAAVILGPAGVGVFNQMSLVWNLFQVAGQLGSFLGIVQSASNDLARSDDDALHRLMSTFTVLLASASVLLGLAGAVYARPLSDVLLSDGGEHAGLIRLLMIGVPFGVLRATLPCDPVSGA